MQAASGPHERRDRSHASCSASSGPPPIVCIRSGPRVWWAEVEVELAERGHEGPGLAEKAEVTCQAPGLRQVPRFQRCCCFPGRPR